MLKDSLKTIILSAIVLFLMGVAYAWTEPSQSPPLGNVSAPITTSGTGQTKTGSLEVNGLWNRGTTILDGNVGVGTISPSQKLSVAGTIESISGGIKFPDGTTQATAASGGGFSSGTSIVFFQASCPSGWTQNVSYNDRMIRIAGTGGGVGGNWTISGLSSSTAGDHNHSIPSHTHSVSRDGWGHGAGFTDGRMSTITSNNAYGANNDNTTGSGGGGTSGNAGSHTHTISQDGSWRPAYIDAIICQKN